MTIRRLNVLVELNGADPVHIMRDGDVGVDLLDWDEISTLSSDELVRIHDRWEQQSPLTARSIRDELRQRGVRLPQEYAHEGAT